MRGVDKSEEWSVKKLKKTYRKEPWLNPKVEIRDSGIHGKGVFAKEPISKGEIVVIWGGSYVSKEEVGKVRKQDPNIRVQQIDDDVFEVFTKQAAGNDPTYFHNHSCNPNTWMEDEVTISAMREIHPDEELTIDYVMFEMKEDYLVTENCVCGSPNCRKRITGRDWRLPELQVRYDQHFSPLINRYIANLTHGGIH